MIRKLVSRLNKSVTKQIVAQRKDLHLPIKISITPDRPTGRLNGATVPETLSIRGETKDLSKTGISFVVSAIRIKEYYLVNEGRTLNAEIDLPDGTKTKMQIVAQRYEQINIHDSISEYFIGAKITQMNQGERDIYEEFLKTGGKSKAGILQLKTDQS
ncbi:hypothetical protein BH20ACI4_BH20ACI4_13690 [soil metagenome]